MKLENVLLEKSKKFAIRIIGLYKYLTQNPDVSKREFVLSKQILKSGTSIGANARESRRAQSTADFISKLSIAEKEADETTYWLELLYATDYINQEIYDSLYADCEELIKLLASIIKTISK